MIPGKAREEWGCVVTLTSREKVRFQHCTANNSWGALTINRLTEYCTDPVAIFAPGEWKFAQTVYIDEL